MKKGNLLYKRFNLYTKNKNKEAINYLSFNINLKINETL